MTKIREYIEIFIGVVLIGVSLSVFYMPQYLVTGGITGVAIILYDIFNVPLWVTNVTMNIPILLMGYKLLGRGIFFKTLFGSMSLTGVLYVMQFVPCIEPDIIIAVVFGGVVMGVGTALVLRKGATSGGTVLLSAILHRKVKYIKVTTFILIIDAVIIIAGMVVFGPLKMFYAIASVYVFTKVTDAVISGFRTAKATFILSTKSSEICQTLMKEIKRGITIIPVRGGYSGQEKDMLLCTMNQKDLVKAKEIIKEIDPTAFVIVTTVNEVLGNGFSLLE